MTTATAFKQFRTISPEGLITINPHPGQLRVMNSRARFVMFLGGTQVGKTCLGPVWLHREIDRMGAGDYLATTSTYDMFKLKMLPELLSEFVEGMVGDGGSSQNYEIDIGKYWPGLRIIELAEDLKPGEFWATNENDRMWGRIILRSADAKAGLESATAKAAWLDELGQKEFTREAWEATRRRLSLSQGRVLGTTSLYYWGWLKLELYDKWKAGDTSIDIIQYDSLTNPAFPRAEYEAARQTMPSWKFNLFYRGIYEKPAGLIYSTFDEVYCKKPRLPFETYSKWPVYVGHDFGPVNMAATFYAIDPTTGLMWLFASYRSEGTVYHHVQEFQKITKGMNVVRRIGGAAGRSNEEGWREAFTSHGWPIQSPKESMRHSEARIQRVYEQHTNNKIMVMDDQLDYLNEKMAFSYKLTDDYTPMQNQIDQEARYHLMSAEQYIISDFTPETVTTTEIRQSTRADRVMDTQHRMR